MTKNSVHIWDRFCLSLGLHSIEFYFKTAGFHVAKQLEIETLCHIDDVLFHLFCWIPMENLSPTQNSTLNNCTKTGSPWLVQLIVRNLNLFHWVGNYERSMKIYSLHGPWGIIFDIFRWDNSSSFFCMQNCRKFSASKIKWWRRRRHNTETKQGVLDAHRQHTQQRDRIKNFTYEFFS